MTAKDDLRADLAASHQRVSSALTEEVAAQAKLLLALAEKPEHQQALLEMGRRALAASEAFLRKHAPNLTTDFCVGAMAARAQNLAATERDEATARKQGGA